MWHIIHRYETSFEFWILTFKFIVLCIIKIAIVAQVSTIQEEFCCKFFKNENILNIIRYTSHSTRVFQIFFKTSIMNLSSKLYVLIDLFHFPICFVYYSVYLGNSYNGGITDESNADQRIKEVWSKKDYIYGNNNIISNKFSRLTF